jgi:hypothetical protein
MGLFLGKGAIVQGELVFVRTRIGAGDAGDKE